VGQKRGGIERVAHELAHELARRRHAVTVWTYDPAPAGAAYKVNSLPARRFVTSWLGRRLTMGYLGNLLFLLPKYGPVDVLLAHGDSVLLPLLGRPLVRVMHGSALGEALSASSPWRFLLQLGIYAQELWCGATQSGCVAGSRNTRRYDPFIRRVIPYGVNTVLFQPDPAVRAAHPSLLFVGALDGRKRGRLLLDWFTRLIQPRFPHATLDLVCPPGPPSAGVRYHTGLSDDELAGLYQKAWVYASPSRYEGFGLPYLEAMASGTPVVATPNPGSREVLDEGRYGIIAEDHQFASEVIRLLGDAAHREELCRKGLDRAAELSLERMVNSYEEFLYRVARKE
jgi:glycosyltransferase involved in cell wall biosynthesis